MKKLFIIIFILTSVFTLTACDKDDSHLSDPVFEKYSEALDELGYNLVKINADNNVSSWLNIVDKDVVSIYKTVKDGSNDVIYMYVFSTYAKAEKQYARIKEEVSGSDYGSILDGHYVIVAKGYNLFDIASDLSN